MGGGVFWVWVWGGGSADFIFMGAGIFLKKIPVSPKPHPARPHPCNMPQAETEIELQFLESCPAEVALQHWLSAMLTSLLPKAALQQTGNCIATLKKLRRKKVALFCHFPADFRLPRSGPAENPLQLRSFELRSCWNSSAATSHKLGRTYDITWYAKNAASKSKTLMPLFLMGCFPVDFQEVKRPLRTKSGKRPIKIGKRPIKRPLRTKSGKRPIKIEKRPIKAMVLVGISVGCLMGCFRTSPPWLKTAPLKRPIKRSMTKVLKARDASCDVISSGVFLAVFFGRKRPHHVLDVSCSFNASLIEENFQTHMPTPQNLPLHTKRLPNLF